MRAIFLLAGAALSLSACGGGDEATTENVDTLEVNNLVVDNAVVDANATIDANATMNAEETANAVATDLTTNDADANLANGM